MDIWLWKMRSVDTSSTIHYKCFLVSSLSPLMQLDASHVFLPVRAWVHDDEIINNIWNIEYGVNISAGLRTLLFPDCLQALSSKGGSRNRLLKNMRWDRFPLRRYTMPRTLSTNFHPQGRRATSAVDLDKFCEMFFWWGCCLRQLYTSISIKRNWHKKYSLQHDVSNLKTKTTKHTRPEEALKVRENLKMSEKKRETRFSWTRSCLSGTVRLTLPDNDSCWGLCANLNSKLIMIT